ncbi:antibiotic biosynthesis monooxygenase family protein [Chloroflexota bacterium]
MFARVTTAYISINKTDEAIRTMKEDIMPAAKTQKGFYQFFGLSDRKTGKGITISLWDTEEDAIANEQSGYYQQQVGKLAPYFITAPIREGYEVTTQG